MGIDDVYYVGRRLRECVHHVRLAGYSALAGMLLANHMGCAADPHIRRSAAAERQIMQVTNVNGTSGETCKCGDWLEHWKKFSGQPVPQYCSELRCSSNDLVGVHVQRPDGADRNWYIIPLCRNHSTATGATLTVGDHLKLVPASVSKTCGK